MTCSPLSSRQPWPRLNLISSQILDIFRLQQWFLEFQKKIETEHLRATHRDKGMQDFANISMLEIIIYRFSFKSKAWRECLFDFILHLKLWKQLLCAKLKLRAKQLFKGRNMNSVTRFDEISPLWQYILRHWQNFDGLFTIWQNFVSTLAKVLCS